MADVIMNNLRRQKVIVIRGCLGCPLSHLEFSEVYCSGLDKKKRHYVSLISQAEREGIPEWCPLPDQAFIKDA